MSNETNPPVIGGSSSGTHPIAFALKTTGLWVHCSHCGLALTTSGALLFSPPNQDGLVEKHHFCVACFHKITGLLAT